MDGRRQQAAYVALLFLAAYAVDLLTYRCMLPMTAFGITNADAFRWHLSSHGGLLLSWAVPSVVLIWLGAGRLSFLWTAILAGEILQFALLLLRRSGGPLFYWPAEEFLIAGVVLIVTSAVIVHLARGWRRLGAIGLAVAMLPVHPLGRDAAWLLAGRVMNATIYRGM